MVLEVLGSWVGVGLVGVAISGPTLLCLASFVWLCSCTVTMATAVSAGAATTGVRGHIGLCSCAASVIALVTVAAVGVLEYVYGQ